MSRYDAKNDIIRLFCDLIILGENKKLEKLKDFILKAKLITLDHNFAIALDHFFPELRKLGITDIYEVDSIYKKIRDKTSFHTKYVSQIKLIDAIINLLEMKNYSMSTSEIYENLYDYGRRNKKTSIISLISTSLSKSDSPFFLERKGLIGLKKWQSEIIK